MSLFTIADTLARARRNIPADYEWCRAELLPHAPARWETVKFCYAKRVPRVGRQKYDRWQDERWVIVYREEIEKGEP